MQYRLQNLQNYLKMARKFKAFVERPKPRKRPRRHSKKLNKHTKRQTKKYNRQGRPQQT